MEKADAHPGKAVTVESRALWARCTHALVRVCDALQAGSLFVSKVFTWALVGILSFEVVMRYVFNRPTGFADEVSGYFLAALVMTGIVYTFKIDAHVRVDILLEYLTPEWRRRLVRLMNALAIPPLLLLTWLSIRMTVDFYTSGRRSFASILQIPLWIPVALVPLGMILLLLQIVGSFCEPGKKRRTA